MTTKNISVKIDEKTLEKLKCVAEYENRSVSNCVLMFIKESIRAFEDYQNDNLHQ